MCTCACFLHVVLFSDVEPSGIFSWMSSCLISMSLNVQRKRLDIILMFRHYSYGMHSFPTVLLFSLLLTVYSLKVGQRSDTFIWLHLLVGRAPACFMVVHVDYS